MAKLTEKITDALSTLGVERSFGSPIALGDETIVPVAAVWMGVGGGVSADAKEGEGAGGGGVSLPMGVYVSVDGRTKFRANPILVLAVSVPLVCVTGRALARMIRAGKRRR